MSICILYKYVAELDEHCILCHICLPYLNNYCTKCSYILTTIKFEHLNKSFSNSFCCGLIQCRSKMTKLMLNNQTRRTRFTHM